MLAVASRTVVEARIEEEVARDVFVHDKRERVLPLHQHSLISSVGIEASLPTHVLSQLPVEVDRNLRTEIVLHMLVSIESETCGEFLVAHVGELIGYRSQVGRALQLALQPVDVVVHTE